MPHKTSSSSGNYRADSIRVLEGLEPVRKTPGMYIGSTGPDGLHHLVWEVCDNSLDEAIAGFASHIVVSILKDNEISVSDNGRGIPVEVHPQTKKSTLETVLTHLHAGGKFGTGAYKVSGGLHGVGVSIVNALSEYVRAEVRRDGFVWEQEYERGKPFGKVKKGKATSETGTTIRFRPDPTVFKETGFDVARIIRHLRNQAFLTPKTRITIRDLRPGGAGYEFYFENGVRSFLEYLLFDQKPIQGELFWVSKEKDDTLIDVAFSYVEDSESAELAFANNIRNAEGGMHLTGFRSALTKAFNEYGKEKGIFKKENGDGFTGEDVREGIVAVVSVKLPNPQFEGQTKMKLGNPEVRSQVESVVGFALKEYLAVHPEDAKRVMQKLLTTVSARIAAKSAKEAVLRKTAFSGLTLPGKLADCSSRKPEESELFVVEGDSAGGSAKWARDRKFQAVYPPFGKILNIERTRLDKVLSSEKIRDLVIVVGTGIGQDFNLGKIRYHKIILAQDADVDGNHIRTLWLAFFYHHMRPIIERGYLYIAQPPLYKIKSGKVVEYAYNDAQKNAILKRLKDKSIDVQRYKGLGEMNPDELWETTMDPERRVLKQVTIEDAIEAERMFGVLMGKEVEPRRRFIETYAKEVRNLDI